MIMNQIKHFLIIFFGLISTCFSHETTEVNSEKPEYQIVIDAGSTGTRLHIFKLEINDNEVIPNIEEVYYAQVSTGIASHINSQRDINEHLASIFNPAQRFCFQSKIPCTNAPVHFLATGGTRILKPSQQKNLFNYVQTWLEDYSVFQNVIEARILTGKEEAELGWLTSFETELRKNKPVGAYFELGGASLQYVYLLKDATNANSHFRAGKKDIYLKSGSWLGFGLNEATDRVIDYWHISHAVCFPKGVEKESNFNYPKCFSLFQNYLNVNQDFHLQQTLIDELVKTNAPIKLGAAFDYLVFNGLKVNNPGKFHDKLKNVCSKQWRNIRSEYFDLVSVHQTEICAHGTYVLTLFDTLNLPRNYSNYTFNNFSWSRGVIIKSWLKVK